MWKALIFLPVLFYAAKLSTAFTRDEAAAKEFYQNLRRKTLEEVQGRSRFNIPSRRTYQAVQNAATQRSPLAPRWQNVPAMRQPVRIAPVRRVLRPAVPARKYISPIRSYSRVSPGRIAVAPAIKRTRTMAERIFLQQQAARRANGLRQKYAASHRYPNRPMIQRTNTRGAPARLALPKPRYAVPARLYRPKVYARPKTIIASTIPHPARYPQQFAVYRSSVYQQQRKPTGSNIRRPLVVSQRQRVAAQRRQKTWSEQVRNAMMWKKYLRAEHNPYANQIARRISYQSLRRGVQPKARYPQTAKVRMQAPYARGYRQSRPEIQNGLKRQMQTSYNTQYSVSGTSTNSGTNSNTVLKGPGKTQTNNQVKVTQNTGVRRNMNRVPTTMERYYQARARALYARESTARAKAKARAKASAGASSSSSSKSSSGSPGAPPPRTSPPRGGSGGGGYGYGAGYGWGSSGGGGFGYGGGGANGYPFPFPYGFGGFPYIPGGFGGGGGGGGSSASGNPPNKYGGGNRKKKVGALNNTKGQKIDKAYRPLSNQKKPAKAISRPPKVGQNKVNTATGRAFQTMPGRAAYNLKYYSTADGSRPGALRFMEKKK